MLAAPLTQQIDLIQVLIVAFVLFFLLLVVYLHREDKREGYPLVVPGRSRRMVGWPSPPPTKTYRLLEGGVVELPNFKQQPAVNALRSVSGPGAPLDVPGDLLTSRLGAGATVLMRDVPMTTLTGEPLLAPLRHATGWSVSRGELDPRGMRVLSRNYVPVGIVEDLWIDHAAKILRYLEVRLDADGSVVLLPIFFAHIRQADREIRVKALRTKQFALVPRLRDPDVMTAREEDELTAFYAGGEIYADPNPQIFG